MTQYHIPCDGLHAGTILDHYPLTTQEVIDLLEVARITKDNSGFNPQEALQALSSIQIRLDQAIPGMTCPRPIDGPVAEKQRAFDEAYVEWIKDPMTLFLKEQPITEQDEIVVTLTNLMKQDDEEGESDGDETEEDRIERQAQAHLEAAARWNDEHGPFS